MKEQTLEYEIDSLEALNDEQETLVKQAVEHVNSVIDLEKIREWCQNQNDKHVFIFGSRTQLKQKEHSDLDIMVLPTGSNTMNRKRILNFLQQNHETFRTFLKQNIELDFKLNVSEEDTFFGYTYNKDDELKEDLDFHFQWSDVPSVVRITEQDISFEIFEPLNQVFDGNQFRDVK